MEAPAGPSPGQSRGSGTALGLETVELERLGKRDIDVKVAKTNCEHWGRERVSMQIDQRST